MLSICSLISLSSKLNVISESRILDLQRHGYHEYRILLERYTKSYFYYTNVFCIKTLSFDRSSARVYVGYHNKEYFMYFLIEQTMSMANFI